MSYSNRAMYIYYCPKCKETFNRLVKGPYAKCFKCNSSAKRIYS